ncbi:Uridine nucleosidase 1 [Aphelenchoides fujianensis]|nr:Uridine nucleosidase 1 [Aphelenchoides fujianensis]
MLPVVFLLLVLAVRAAEEEREDVVIDTDGVVDDVKALSLALQHPRLRVVAITTVAGSTTVEQATANVARTLRANRIRHYIPVVKGAEHALIGNLNTTADGVLFFGDDGLSNAPLAAPKVARLHCHRRRQLACFQALPADSTVHVRGVEAAEALVELFSRRRGQLTLIALGPVRSFIQSIALIHWLKLTNLALALKLEPAFAEWPKKLVLTGGNFYGMGNIRTASTAEFNFNADPEAAEIVLQGMRCPITIVAWETTFFFQDLRQEKHDFKQHISLDLPLARFFRAASRRPRQFMARFGLPYRYCDEITVAAAAEPAVIAASRNVSAAVELHGAMTRGQLVIGWLEEYLGASAERPMRRVQLVMDYDFAHLDRLMQDAIRRVPDADDFV